MRSGSVACAFAVPAALLLAACGAPANSGPAPSPAATLYAFDHGKPPTGVQARPYERALRRAAGRCDGDEATVAHYIPGTVKQIADDTGRHLSALEVLVKFSKTWSPTLSCAQRFTAYALVLEGSS